MPITPLPAPPSRTVPATFADLGDAFLGALPTFATEMEDARQTAVQAIADAAAATSAAAVVTAATNVNKWVTGTNYAEGVVVWSPSDYQAYRKKAAGVSSVDPANAPADWERINTLAFYTLFATADLTLTASSAPFISVAPASRGIKVVLPDATTCIDGWVRRISNTSAYDLAVTNSAGTLLGFVAGNSSAIIALSDNATAAGTWANDLTPYGIDVSAELTIGINTNMTYALQLDANRTLLLFGVNTLAAVVYDQSTRSFGAATVATTLAASGNVSLTLINANAVLLVIMSGGYIRAKVLTFSGTSITVGADASFAHGGTATVEPSWFKTIAIGGSYIIAYRTNAPTTNIVAMSVALGANTVTFGSAAQLYAGAGGSVGVSLADMGGGLGVAVYNGPIPSVRPFTVSGTTLALGAVSTLAGNFAAPNIAMLRTLASGRLAFIWSPGGSTTYAAIISASSLAAPAVSQVTLLASAPPHFIWQFGSQILCYGGTTTVYANVLTDNAGTAVAGTAVSFVPGGGTYSPRTIGVHADGLTLYSNDTTGPMSARLTLSGNNATVSVKAYKASLGAIYHGPSSTRYLNGYSEWYENYTTDTVETLAGSRMGIFFGKPDTASTTVTQMLRCLDGEYSLVPALIPSVFRNSGRPAYLGPGVVWGCVYASATSVVVQRMRIA